MGMKTLASHFDVYASKALTKAPPETRALMLFVFNTGAAAVIDVLGNAGLQAVGNGANPGPAVMQAMARVALEVRELGLESSASLATFCALAKAKAGG